MFQRISLCGAKGEELFWGFSVLRSDPPPPLGAEDLPAGANPPGNDNGDVSKASHMRLAAATPSETALRI